MALATLQRVLDLDGDQVQARERYAELLTKSARALDPSEPNAKELTRQAVEQYEQVLEAQTEAESKRRVLAELVALAPERADLRERMAEVSIELGDTAEAVLELQELAVEALQAGKLERAVEVLEKIVELDPDDIMALQSLGDTYARLGRTKDAVAQYQRFAKSLEESGLAAASADTLVDIYEKVVELDPDNTSARRYLAKAYQGKEHADKAVGNLSRIAQSLRGKEGQEQELLETLEKLHELKPADLELALERARLAKQLGKGEQSRAIFRSVAETAQVQGDHAKAMAAWRELLNENPGDLEGHLALARMQVANKGDEAEAARRCAAVFELAMIAEREDLAYEAVKQALDADPDEPRHRERLARVQVLRGREDEAARTLVRAARRARDDEDLGLCRSWARRALDLDATCDDARDLLESLRRAREQPALVQEEAPPAKTVQATITGGARAPQIQGRQTKSKRLGKVAERLRNMQFGPSAPRAEPAETEKVSRKASSAMSKLRALRSGGGDASSGASPALGGGEQKVSKGPEAPGEAADATVSKKAGSALSKLRAMRGGGEPASAAPSAEQKVSKGPEAPGEAADATLSKKAKTARNKLRALRSGGGSAPAAAPSGEQQVSKGPEAPGEAAEEGVSKKASSALNKLKMLRSGGGSAPAAAPSGEQQVSKGPEAPGEAADEGVSKKAKTARNKLRALRSGGASAPAAAPSGEQQVSKGPEAPGEAADEGVSKKASSALNKLKALRSGGGSTPAAAPAANQQVSKGPEAPGEAADEGVSKKASSALNKLKALRSGGGSAPAAAPAANQQVSKGPEAPGEAVDEGVSKKASSALSRLKALRSGGGSAPAAAPAAGQQVSKGPEAPGEAAEEGVSKKASSALSRLKALRSGGGGAAAPAASADKKISKGPEAPGEAADEQVSKKASSAMSRLRALKAGGDA
ncbi:MAG TPA: hypothetical protein DEA08_07995 [Planctomycetes bacterium]|nr:hypothetical protein [Planctomycetota bacterium]